ncbi:hypothetical protein [Leifsonia sp. Leaf264]|uniref:hypothetical protein n=1 Tax=Leifsonia sp. Leaf264 TaxID=1736314 RepID=UPI000700EAA6|nr:hypothetical protein [Leifsonia sp. Leaf264]KQO98397.1 hypothetical protein ASF30_10070 [Leifsonia sp. Leaf264]
MTFELVPHDTLPVTGCDCGGCFGTPRPDYDDLVAEITRLRAGAAAEIAEARSTALSDATEIAERLRRAWAPKNLEMARGAVGIMHLIRVYARSTSTESVTVARNRELHAENRQLRSDIAAIVQEQETADV